MADGSFSFPQNAGTDISVHLLHVEILHEKLIMPLYSINETDYRGVLHIISYILTTPAPLHFGAGSLLMCTLCDIDRKGVTLLFLILCQIIN